MPAPFFAAVAERILAVRTAGKILDCPGFPSRAPPIALPRSKPQASLPAEWRTSPSGRNDTKKQSVPALQEWNAAPGAA